MAGTRTPMTAEQIARTITSAGDSVTVINEAITKLTNGATPSLELKNLLQRNVDHLKIVVAKEDIVAAGTDVSALNTGITAGQAKLDGTTWPAEPAKPTL